MTRLTKMLGLFTLVACCTAMTGCIKFKQVMTLMPDGSGKIQMRIGLSEQLVAMAKEQGEDPFKEFTPGDVGEGVEGIVAFTQPKKEKQGNYTYMTIDMYFRDVNKVKMEAMGEGKPPEFTYKREGDTATLTVKNGTMLSMIADHEPTAGEEKAQMRAMMTGLEFSEHFVLPGMFKDIDGVAAVDNTAKIDVTLDNLLDGTGPIKELKGKDELTFSVTDITVSDEEVQAFQKELEDAVKAWEKMKKEAEDAQ